MGTPSFSVGILEAMVKEEFIEIKGIVTVADKPAGRGQTIQQSAVKQYAVAHNIPVLQPVNLKDEEFIESLKAWEADVFVVVAFRMLPKSVWSIPTYKTFNLHASLLPDYRGAAPINWTIINGDKYTGITTFFIDEEIDTGNIILQEEMEVGEKETLESLHDRMMLQGGQLVVKTLNQLASGTCVTTAQNEKNGPRRPAPKLNRTNTKIDWTKSGQEIDQLVRGLNPYPAAWTQFKNPKGEIKQVKIYEVEEIEEAIGEGKIISRNKNILIGLKKGAIVIKNFQMEGKKRMTTGEWLVGNKVEGWEIV